MQSITNRPVCATLAALLACAALPTALEAQSHPTRPTVAAIADGPLEDSARVLVVRNDDMDVIVLSSDEQDLTTALWAGLRLLREARTEPLRPGLTQVVGVSGFVEIRPPSDARKRAIAAQARRLERASTTRIGNLGPGRWIQLPRGLVSG